jgi:hypothetical protein
MKDCIWLITVDGILIYGPGAPDDYGRLKPCYYNLDCGYERRLLKDDYCEDSDGLKSTFIGTTP